MERLASHRMLWSLAPVLLAFSVQLALWSLITPYVWFLFYPALFVSSWIGGLRRGMVATALSAAMVWWFFVEPTHTFVKESNRHFFPLTVFLLMGAVFGAFNQRLRNTTRRSEEATARVTELLQQTRELDAVKTEFFANVSHELRTPLALILGSTQRLLGETDLSPPVRDQVGMVERSGRQLLRQVNELLEVSKLEARQVELDYSEIDLAALVSDVAEPFAHLAEDRGVTFVVDLPDHLPAQLDGTRVERCLLNLLSNAFRFTPALGTVRLTVRSLDGAAELEVADSGPGIPVDEREAVFERFQQVRRGEHRGAGGTGLGLALARDVAVLHGGRLVVHDAPEGGALLRLTLPVRAPEGTPMVVTGLPSQEVRSDLEAAVEELGPAVSPALPRPRSSPDVPVVLVLEDNPDLNHLLCSVLESSYQVLSARDARTALELARRTQPALVLTDLMMPGIDGEEFVRLVRQEPSLLDVPIVVITARSEEEVRVRLLNQGVNDFLTKPFLVPELQARVDNLVRLRTSELSRRRVQARAEGLLEASPDATVVVDASGRIAQVNHQAERMFGYTRAELAGKPVEMLVPEGPRAAHHQLRESFMARPRSRGMGSGLEPVAVRKDGTTVGVDVSLSPVTTPDGPMVIASIRDVSDNRRRQEQLRSLALHDPLTDLPNRVLLMDRLAQALADLERQPGVVAVCYVDLDRFKQVNDTFGHEAGDRLLVEVARRLRGVVRPHDTVSRIGGDEFAVVCGGLVDEQEPLVVAERIEQALRAPVRLGDVEVGTSASVGVTWTRAAGDDPQQLIRSADEAMYGAKNRGPGLIQAFHEDVGVHAAAHHAVEVVLLDALDHDRLRLHYQPIVDMRTGRITGAEALLRIDHPVRGLLAPGSFLEVAESSGLIVPMGAWVMQEACRQLAAWQQVAPGLRMSVNLSGAQLVQDYFPHHVRKALEESGVDPARLCFEMTESVLLDATRVVLANLDGLRAQGSEIAVDDFGTGWSSLTYLKRFQVDVLKIDRSFTEGLGRDRDDTAIVTAITELGHALGLGITIEGVENDMQREQARQLGCDFGQGYHFAPPLDPTRFLERLRSQATSTV